MLLLLLACNTPPGAPSVAIVPNDPTGNDDLEVVIQGHATDDEGDAVSYTYAWFVDDAPRSDLSGATVPAAETTRGETWKVVVTPNDGKLDGDYGEASVVIQNTPPTLGGVSLSPDAPVASDRLTATFTDAADPDGDAISLHVTWTVDGVEMSTERVPSDGAATLSGVFDKGAVVVVTAAPHDGEASGASATASVAIGNSAPSATGAAIEPAPPTAASEVRCVGEGWSDPDGDAAGWRATWTVNGSVVGTEEVLAGGTYLRGDTVECTLTPYDGEAEGPPVEAAPAIVANSPPTCATAAVTIGPDPATVEDTLAVTVDGFSGCADADGDPLTLTYDWQVDGVSVGSDPTFAGALASRGAAITLVATYTDGFDAGASATSNVVTLENAPPVVDGVALSPATVLTDSVVSATVSVSDADADVIALEYAWTVDGVAAGTGATLDGSLFAKGQTVALTVTPSDGLDAGAPVTASVVVGNSAPGAPSVSLLPAAPGDDDALVCSIAATASDPDGDTLSYTFAWTVGGVAWTGATTTTFPGDTVPAASTALGQTWACAVTASDGAASGPAGAASAEIGGCVTTVYYPDHDGDTYGDADGGVASCDRPSGWLTNGDDCDDTSASIRPGGAEVCDDADADEDCDGLVDDADPSVTGGTLLYVDADGDGYGEEGSAAVSACDAAGGYSEEATDCDDADDTVSPGMEEVCRDGVDNDCSDDGYPCAVYGDYDHADLYVEDDDSFLSFAEGLTVGDIDGDGVADLVIGEGEHGTLDVFRGPLALGEYTQDDAAGTFTASGSMLASSFANDLVAVPDMDGDGDDELIFSWASWSLTFGVTLLEGSPSLALGETSLGTDERQYVAGSAGDFDGDGLGDAYTVYRASTDTLTLYRGDASGVWSTVTWTNTEGDFGETPARAGSDLDGDGLDDLLVDLDASSGSDAVFALLGEATPAGGSLTRDADAWITMSGVYDLCAPGDVTGDGYADAGVMTSAGAFYLFEGPPGARLITADVYATGADVDDCWGVDTDGDGNRELALLPHWDAEDYTHVYAGPVDPGALPAAGEARIPGEVESHSSGDLTDDGYDDFVVGTTYTAFILPGGEW